jgi:hypothetical protein
MASEEDNIIFIFVIVVMVVSAAAIFPCFQKLKREGFRNKCQGVGYPTTQLCTVPLTTLEPLRPGPGEATLSKPREPYHLLGDHLPQAAEDERIANLTSECSYIADGQRLIEKTGSYGQVTNNYRHKTPDNGTTWRHELSVSFYKGDNSA